VQSVWSYVQYYDINPEILFSTHQPQVPGMKKTLFSIGAVLLIVTFSQSATGDHQTPNDELNAFWNEITRTVEEGDFYGMAATYHDDAVLANGMSGTTYPISSALAGWKPNIDKTKAGEIEATVEFRFTQRLSDPTTALETGIFHYAATPSGGELNEYYVHFEALLVKKDNGWLMMMEYQKSSATAEEFEAIAPME